MYKSLEAESSKDNSPPSPPTKVALRGTQRFATVFKEKRGLQPYFVTVLPRLSRCGTWCDSGTTKTLFPVKIYCLTQLLLSVQLFIPNMKSLQ